jgi:hypothetical protein
MIAGLRRLQAGNSFEFETVDIDVDATLARRYEHKVPVLAYGDRELCHYYLEPAVITAFLAEFR